MEPEFYSIEELYKRVYPALKTKKSELFRLGYNYIKEEDIWNYLSEKTWKNSRNLELHKMVDDVLNIDEVYIDSYVKDKLHKKTRKIYFNEEDDLNEKTNF